VGAAAVGVCRHRKGQAVAGETNDHSTSGDSRPRPGDGAGPPSGPQLLVEPAPALISYQDTQLRTVWTFRGVSKGPQPPREYVGQTCHEAWGRDEPCPECPARQAMADRQPRQAQVISPDHRQWLVRCYPVTDEEGRLAGAIKVAHPFRQFAGDGEDTPSVDAANVLDALDDHVALLDSAGRILSVNQAWLRFARENDGTDIARLGAGADYIEVCRASAQQDSPLAREALAGLQAVLQGRREQFELVYPCHSPDQQRWFLMRVRRLAEPRGAVISHADITNLQQTAGHPGRGQLLSQARQRVAALTEQVESLRHLARQHQRQLRESDIALDDNALLVREMHHRIKNSLTMVAGLIGLHADRLDEPRLQEALEDVRLRVQAISAVHSICQPSQAGGTVDLAVYARSLIREAQVAWGQPPDRERLSIKLSAEPWTVPFEQALPVGLILNELILNAVQHAFPEGQSGEIRVVLESDDRGRLVIEVSDNGTGLPAGFDLHTVTSLGLQLVVIQTDQLAGTVEASSDGGATFRVTLGRVCQRGDE
jgi:two-component sensor histidine kinase